MEPFLPNDANGSNALGRNRIHDEYSPRWNQASRPGILVAVVSQIYYARYICTMQDCWWRCSRSKVGSIGPKLAQSPIQLWGTSLDMIGHDNVNEDARLTEILPPTHLGPDGRQSKATQGPSWGYLKVNFQETLSFFGDKCPQNGSKNDPMVPRTTLGCPHEGPRVVNSMSERGKSSHSAISHRK